MTPSALLHSGYATVAVPPCQAKLTVPQCHGCESRRRPTWMPSAAKRQLSLPAIVPDGRCVFCRIMRYEAAAARSAQACPDSAQRGQAPTGATHWCERGERSKPGSLRRFAADRTLSTTNQIHTKRDTPPDTLYRPHPGRRLANPRLGQRRRPFGRYPRMRRPRRSATLRRRPHPRLHKQRVRRDRHAPRPLER